MKNSVLIKNVSEIDPKLCVGCGACEQSCYKNAVVMRPDKEGFLHPSVDEKKCTFCGDCVVVCQASNNEYKKQTPLSVYACQAKDAVLLNEATAGGLFPVLASYVLDKNGIVYGAAYDSKMKVVHIGINKKEEIFRFSGSKYVQSDTSHVYKEVKAHLESGKLVLFSGTPCQVVAILKFCAGAPIENLITIDVVCYGVPSPALFRSYLDKVEKKHHSRITDFRFRDKHTYGWSHTTVIKTVDSKGGQHVIEEPDYKKIPYFRMFSQRDCFRKSCYACSYNTIERASDFTTGNFWGIEKISTSFDTYKGVSMLLINTKKAEQIFEQIKEELFIERRSVEEAVLANDALVKGSVYPPDRDDIYRCFEKSGFSKMIRKFYSAFSKRRILSNLYHFKKKILKK